MEDIKKQIAKLRVAVTATPLSARQGLRLGFPAPGQLHYTNMPAGSDWFYFIAGVSEARCEVIPGSFDALMAGPNDIVLPPSVLGAMVFLALDLAASVPRQAIGIGFAVLDDATCGRISVSRQKYEAGQPGNPAAFPFALPYVSRHDPRISYHKKMADLILREQANYEEEMHRAPFIVPPMWSEDLALAAGNEKENIRKKCAIDGRPEVLILEYSPEENTAWVDLFSADLSARSGALDGARIVNVEETVLGIIENGRCRFRTPAGFDGGIALQLGDGSLHILTPEP